MDEIHDPERHDFINAILGRAPEAFKERLDQACALLSKLNEIELLDEQAMDDVFLICAFTMYQWRTTNHGKEPLKSHVGFNIRARQVAKWIGRHTPDFMDEDFAPDSVPALQNKGQEIARQISEKLYDTEAFILFLVQKGTPAAPGFSTYLSNLAREECLQFLENHLRAIKKEFRKS